MRDSGALNRSLFISEAIHNGLQSFDKANVEGKRNRRIDASTSRESKDKVKQLAETYELTQQSILRHLVLRYANEAHWKHSAAATVTQATEDEAQ